MPIEMIPDTKCMCPALSAAIEEAAHQREVATTLAEVCKRQREAIHKLRAELSEIEEKMQDAAWERDLCDD